MSTQPSAGTKRGAMRWSGKRRLVDLAIDAFLVVFGIAMVLPLLMLVANAFKTPQELVSWPPTFIPNNPTLDNVTAVLNDTPLLVWMFNSFAFAALSTVAILVTSAIAGYILGKFRYRSLNVIFLIILATAIVPFEVYMIPLYFQVQSLGLLNSLWGLLIGYLVMSFGIFLIRQNVIHSVPDELLEAARIDGAGELWIFFSSSFRSAQRLALAVLAFFRPDGAAWPLIVATTRESYTIEVGLALFQTGFTVDLGKLSAASAIVLIPSVTLFVMLQELRRGRGRHRAQGMSMSRFMASARAEYARINAATLQWVLDRPRLHGAYLNTKLNPLTLADYTAADGLRGPDFIYGWIQGRGLESLVTHAGWFEDEAPALSARLHATARELYGALEARAGGDATPISVTMDRSSRPAHGPRWLDRAGDTSPHLYLFGRICCQGSRLGGGIVRVGGRGFAS